MAVDIEKIKKRLLEIENNLEKISKYAGLKDESFWSDERNIFTIKHLLLESIEAAGSICAHIAAKKYHQAVSSFGECFFLMGEKGLLNDNLTESMQQMVSFRNLLVHEYWHINDEKVLKYARNNLSDFREFISAVKNNIKF